MWPPERLQLGAGQVLRLKKSLYGLRQAGRNWYHCLRSFLMDIGFTPLQTDVCVFIRHSGERFAAISTHVDDLLVLVDSEDTFNLLLPELSSRFKISESGDLALYCGIKVESRDGGLLLTQPYFTRKVLEAFNMTECNPRTTPLERTPLRAATDEDALTDLRRYQQLCGCLIWLSTNTRPDIAFAVSLLTRYMSKPTTKHWDAAKQVLRYLRGPLRGIFFCKSTPMTPVVYSDADLGGDLDTRQTTAAHVVMMCGGPVIWKSLRIRTIVQSTAEAEYCAQTEGARSLKFIDNLLIEMGLAEEHHAPYVMHCDNQSALAMLSDLKTSGRTRHIDIKLHYARQLVTDGFVTIEYCPTGKMTADLLTKALPRTTFETHRESLTFRA